MSSVIISIFYLLISYTFATLHDVSELSALNSIGLKI